LRPLVLVLPFSHGQIQKRALEHIHGVGGLQQPAFRAARRTQGFSVARGDAGGINFIDGDLVERVLELPPAVIAEVQAFLASFSILSSLPFFFCVTLSIASVRTCWRQIARGLERLDASGVLVPATAESLVHILEDLRDSH
jgi:hypothetical protein